MEKFIKYIYRKRTKTIDFTENVNYNLINVYALCTTNNGIG
jgi:hypothetical protein